MGLKETNITSAIGKGMLGTIPIIGPIVVEIVNEVIPNQRLDRIETLLIYLESKINELNLEKVKERFKTKESLDLLEDSFIQASRALSDERLDYISSMLVNGLSDDEKSHIEYKRLLSILGDLNDLEILILKSKTLRQGLPGNNEFWETHKEALTSPRAHMQSSQEEIDKNTIFTSHKAHLVNLGLLRAKFKKPKKGDMPEFDSNTGMIKAQGHEITRLARLLLRAIDLDEKPQR